jgi:hypothetical protein
MTGHAGRSWGRPLLFLGLIVGAAPSVAAQLTTRDAPLRFGVEYARATPTGDFAALTDAATGFLAWIALPVSRRSPLGLGAEFSVLTVPERQVAVPLRDPTAELSVALRTTVTFVGTGPRVEARVGHLSLGASLMPGFTRVIVDLGGVVRSGTAQRSVALSHSDYALALKGGLALTVPVYVGRHATGIGLAAGVDYTMAGRAPFPDRDSFDYDAPNDRLLLERREVSLSHWRAHAGVAVEF